jgi:hypothetical protein
VKNNLFPYLFLETKYWFWIWDPEKNPFRIPGSKRHRIRNTEKKVPDPDQLIFNNKPFVEPVLELGDLLLVLRGAGDSGPGK